MIYDKYRGKNTGPKCVKMSLKFESVSRSKNSNNVSAQINTLRTGDEFSRLWRFFFTTLKKTDDANLPFNTGVDFTHLITQ
jgi:hypothetical protein